MNLRKLELFGFKSFMRKLDIHFSDGITVIVGPNGCGKTNVTDALRWVLGEGNARMLRGKTMEDLIFNGTRDYKPLNVAEVGLTIDNSSGILPIEYGEVTVARRVYRNGESEFLINKMPCRLKDIHDLFLDTGLGSRAYSVIEREMVEMVLGSEPEKRRELLEEAAGIMKYKIRERAAHRKLQATDEDLARIQDVHSEVERQVRSLKRQVGAAQRWQEVRDRLRALDVQLALVDVQRMRDEERTLAGTMDEEGRVRDEAHGQLARLDAAVEEARGRSAETETAFGTIQREVDDLLEQVRVEERENWGRKERRESLLETAKRLGAEREELLARIAANEIRRTESETRAVEEEARLAELASTLEESKASLARMESDLEGRRGELSRTREAAEALAQEVLRVKTEVANHDAHRDHLADRDAVLAEELRQLEEVGRARGAEAQETRALCARLAEDLTAREEQLQRDSARRDALDAERETARENVARLALEGEAARSGLAMLRGLHESFEGFGPGARSLLASGGARVRALADSLHVTKPELLPALETALGQALEALVTDSEHDAHDAIERLRTGSGRATIVDRGALGRAAKSARAELPQDGAILGRARDFLNVTDDVGALLDVLLGRVALVESLADAARLAKRPEHEGWRFVTRDGDWAAFPGLVHGGSPKAGTDARILGRVDRMSSIDRRIAEIEKERDQAQGRWEKLGGERDALHAAIRALEGARDEARATLAQHERRRERGDAELAAAAARAATVTEERERLAERAREIAEKRTHGVEELAVREEERARLDAAWRGREGELVASSADRDQAQHRAHDLQLEQQRRGAEAEKLRDEAARLSEERRADEDGVARRTEEVATTERAATELAREIELGLERFAKHAEEMEARRRVRDEIARSRSGVLEQLRAIEEERDRWARSRDRARDLSHEAEMRCTKLAAAREERVARAKRESNVDLESQAAVEAHGALLTTSDESLAEARREREELDVQLGRLGPVNMVALEQYEREAKRLEFLAAQRADLEAGSRVSAAHDPQDQSHGADDVHGDAGAGARELQAHLRHAVRRRPRRRPSLRRRGSAARSDRDFRAAPRQTALQHLSAVQRRARAHRGRVPLRDLSREAEPVLHLGRSRRALGRREHRALPGDAERRRQEDAVCDDHAQQEDHGSRRHHVRRDHGRARRFQARFGAAGQGRRARAGSRRRRDSCRIRRGGRRAGAGGERLIGQIGRGLARLRDGLRRTREAIRDGIRGALRGAVLDDAFWEEIEALLLRADTGVDAAEEIVAELRKGAARLSAPDADSVLGLLREIIARRLGSTPSELNIEGIAPPAVVLVVGVNGTGKTTTIGKLAHRLRSDGKHVLLAAADTYRAAAMEQLEAWAQRAGVGIVRGQEGQDAAAVVVDALDAAAARGIDVVIVDTAGRLHTKVNLMDELSKIRRVVDKRIPGAPHETLLVLDATMGQNAIRQAKAFGDTLGITGIVLAKLDGTAKGGAVLAIHEELGVPVKLIGIGESIEDLQEFDPAAFAEALVEGEPDAPAREPA